MPRSARVGVRANEFEHFFDRQAAGLGHAGRLEFGVVQADVRVEAAAGGGDGVGGHGALVARPFCVR